MLIIAVFLVIVLTAGIVVSIGWSVINSKIEYDASRQHLKELNRLRDQSTQENFTATNQWSKYMNTENTSTITTAEILKKQQKQNYSTRKLEEGRVKSYNSNYFNQIPKNMNNQKNMSQLNHQTIAPPSNTAILTNSTVTNTVTQSIYPSNMSSSTASRNTNTFLPSGASKLPLRTKQTSASIEKNQNEKRILPQRPPTSSSIQSQLKVDPQVPKPKTFEPSFTFVDSQ